MNAPLTLNGFDVGLAVERMLGQSDLWWQAVGLFVQHFATWERDWLASRGDDAVECKKVHALRSAAANVGATRLSCAAAVLEELIEIRSGGAARQYSTQCALVCPGLFSPGLGRRFRCPVP